jgi:hypothetical protein
MHVTMAVDVDAPASLAYQVLADPARWPEVFPAIHATEVLGQDGGTVGVLVHHDEGEVRNWLTLVPPSRIDLRERKRRYDAAFVNRFNDTGGGRSRIVVEADLRFRAPWAVLLAPLVRPYARRRMRALTLLPLKRAAESIVRPPDGEAGWASR